MYKKRCTQILLVEDNPGDVELVKEAFEDADFETQLFVVQDGNQALDFLYKRNNFVDAEKPDVVVLDLNLPGTDGREVLQIIKNDPDLKSIPISIFTSSRAERDRIDCYNLHANCYVVKPIDVMEFIYAVQSMGRFWGNLVTLPKT